MPNLRRYLFKPRWLAKLLPCAHLWVATKAVSGWNGVSVGQRCLMCDKRRELVRGLGIFYWIN